MTRLKDDGYLETDDAVVASTVIDQRVTDATGRQRRLRRVGRETCVAANGDVLAYPLVIPAATVAEVCGWEDGTAPLIRTILAIEIGVSWEEVADWIGSWLLTHTGDMG